MEAGVSHLLLLVSFSKKIIILNFHCSKKKRVTENEILYVLVPGRADINPHNLHSIYCAKVAIVLVTGDTPPVSEKEAFHESSQSV